MTRERAAELLSDVTVLDDPEMAEAHRVAISALRQQETVTKCTDLFNEDGGDIYQENDSICSSTNLPCCRCNPGPCDHRQEPVTNRNGFNVPLTLDEMRDMPCEPVYIVVGCASWWDIVSYAGMEYLYLKVEGSLPFRDYGKNWTAYRQKPEEGTV